MRTPRTTTGQSCEKGGSEQTIVSFSFTAIVWCESDTLVWCESDTLVWCENPSHDSFSTCGAASVVGLFQVPPWSVLLVRSCAHTPEHTEVGMFQDIVYRLFASHDEVVLLENSESSRRQGRPQRPRGQEGRSTTSRYWTMREYMDELIALHNKQQQQQKQNSGPEIMPLLHLVFCWDHESQKPRAAGYRRADVALELSKPKDGFEEEQRIEDDDDRQHQPSQLGGASVTPTTVADELLQSDVSFSDYDGHSSQGPLVNIA
ncbi:Hypothetical protein, putative, partial [Bodo saltans]